MKIAPNTGSVRFRTTAGAVLALLVLLAVAGVLINWFVGRAVQDALDTTLLEQATDRAALVSDGASIESLVIPVGAEEVVAAIGPDGTVVASVGAEILSDVLDLPLGVSTVELGIVEPGEQPERETLRAAVAETTTGLRIVVANEGEAAASTRAAVRNVLLAVIPLTALAGALVAWMVTGRALRPVRLMQRELDEVVGAGDGQRITQPGSGDEIDELGSTINGVLDRLDRQVVAQRKFVADASHELKSPLANARAVMDTAKPELGRVEYERVTTSVSTELHRLHGLVDDLLYLARGDEGPPRNPVELDLADLIFDECERVAATSTKHIDASQVAPAQVFVDRAEASRALRNLIENADRFAQERVMVSVRTKGNTVTAVVADDGPGIAPEHRASVFERFTRVEGNRDRSAGGTGLGLSIVASIAHGNHGQILVTDSPTGGAQFELTFPIESGAASTG